MGTKIPRSILVHDSIAIEIKILFLKLAMTLNLNFISWIRKRPQGRPKTTWMQTVRQDLTSIGIKLDLSKEAQTLKRLSDLTHDRKNWRGIVRRVVQYQLRVTS